ncbi:DUF2239 family protein [Caulobacter sp. NIBR1757]|uniref:DUF2239 family protein n=1 Tax=Caulobacter sp. NIBR1757 TaxID=3016000 RepID=UPI0022F06367|nr:DUF2239 family protein [Caulobacter sp. NIBR1757]WGM39839.1 hypothetical protein AMEJIAPC_02779 [Caulobacter sp. NIBR1757]
MTQETTYSLFEGHHRLAQGEMSALAAVARASLARDPNTSFRVFDDLTGERVGLELTPPAKAVGRPKLGIVAREVSLLPRHWDWLAQQQGGPSAALRRLVETARRDPVTVRKDALNAAYRFVGDMAGDLPGFEEATRTLFNDDREGFLANTVDWPVDVRGQALRMLGWS